MNKPRVSVIIPVYNTAAYLERCLNSVTGQTLGEIEIICVDDGSTDGSAKILAGFAKRDSRVRVITQRNAGAGAARNNGLSAASGEYLSFLDADDFFEPDMLSKAYRKCEKTQADFVVFRSDSYLDDRQRFEPCKWTIRKPLLPKKKVFSYRDIEQDVFRLFNGWAWDKLYRRDFVLQHRLTFQEQRTSNDLYFVFAALVQAKNIATVNRVLAHHRRSIADSLSVTREKSWNCFYTALIALREKLLALGLYTELKQSFINYALHFSLWNLNTLAPKTFETLYGKLKTEYFKELGIDGQPEAYFYDPEDYRRLKCILEETPLGYFKQENMLLIDEVERIKRRVIVKHGNTFTTCLYVLYKTATYIPRYIRRLVRERRNIQVENAKSF